MQTIVLQNAIVHACARHDKQFLGMSEQEQFLVDKYLTTKVQSPDTQYKMFVLPVGETKYHLVRYLLTSKLSCDRKLCTSSKSSKGHCLSPILSFSSDPSSHSQQQVEDIMNLWWTYFATFFAILYCKVSAVTEEVHTEISLQVNFA